MDTTTEWTFVSLSPLGGTTLSALLLLIAIGCAAVLWSYRHARRAGLLAGLRCAAAALIALTLIEPALQVRSVRRVKSRVAIVVDKSASMTLRAGDRTRFEHVLAVLAGGQGALERLTEQHVVTWHDLEGPLAAGARELTPHGTTTDLLRGLEHATRAGSGQALAGIVLLSDGADHVDLEAVAAELPEPARQRLLALGVPVNTVDVSAAHDIRDLAIAKVISDDFSFLHNTHTVEALVTAAGFGGQVVAVTLKRDDQPIATQEVTLNDGDSVRVTFQTKPDQIGEFVYSVSVPQLPQEVVTANNERTFVVQVIRDKIRVLQVAGRPSWDERFLRQHLKENPNVDLVSFFILRTPTDDPISNERELSLIPFPVAQLFTTELANFDVLIFQNFDYRPYPMGRYLTNIRDAVQQGLGFVMIGGDESFGRVYQGTAIEEILPLRVDRDDMFHGLVQPELTAIGRSHPVTDLGRGAADSAAVWRDLPGWTSVNVHGGLTPSAVALVTDPQQRQTDGQPLPVVAVRDVGKGRSLAIASDSMWRWRFLKERRGGISERAYHRFWSNALRWLVGDPEHARLRVLPGKRRYELADSVEVTFRAHGADYQPISGAHLTIELLSQDGRPVLEHSLSTGEDGLARYNYGALAPGAYRINAEGYQAGQTLGRGQGVFVVDASSPELRDAAPRPGLLRAVAEVTGGRHLPLAPSLWDDLETAEPDTVEVARRRNVELWDNGWALAVLVLVLAAEWTARRSQGYI